MPSPGGQGRGGEQTGRLFHGTNPPQGLLSELAWSPLPAKLSLESQGTLGPPAPLCHPACRSSAEHFGAGAVLPNT